MGYMGLSHWCDSDGAVDFRSNIQGAEKKNRKAVQAIIRKEMKDRANRWNTDGYINVALVMEKAGEETEYSGITPDPAKYMTIKDFQTLIKGLNQLIKDCDGCEDDNMRWHRVNFQRMLKFVKGKAKR